MKFILICFLLLVASCNQTKKEKPKNQTNKTIITETETVKKEVIKPVKKEYLELLVTLKNPKNVSNAKALIIDRNLVWNDLIINKNTLKVASLKIPIDDKELWIEKLKSLKIFSNIEAKSEENIAAIKEIAENTFVTISKKRCSGDCPVYQLTLLKDGNVIFNGIENVNSLGIQKFSISETKMNKIKSMFQKTTFGTYIDSYVDKSLMDYPSTFITHNDKQIEIKLWKDVPLELALAFETVEDILFDKKIIN